MNNGYIMLNEFTIWPSQFDYQSIWPDWKAAVVYCKYKENHVLKKNMTTTDSWMGLKKEKYTFCVLNPGTVL